MQVVGINNITSIEFESSISPNGQITLPQEIRTKLKLKPKDKVTIRIEAGKVTVQPKKETLRSYYKSLPALNPPRSWDEVRAIAKEDALEQATKRT